MKKKFTEKFLKSIKPPIKGFDKYWDSEDTAFGLFAYSSGKKTWTVMYRVGGKLKSKKVGVYPSMNLE